jgi:hypothetical protein
LNDERFPSQGFNFRLGLHSQFWGMPMMQNNIRASMSHRQRQAPAYPSGCACDEDCFSIQWFTGKYAIWAHFSTSIGHIVV